MLESMFIFAGINMILALSLYVTMSTGQLSLGHGGFMSIGAYASSLMTLHLSVPLPVSLIVGAACAALLGFLIGFPALRIRGIYLAVGTLGFAGIVEVVLNNLEVTGGTAGLSGMQGTNLGTAAVAAVLVLAFVVHLSNSRLGRSFHAVEQDEVAAQSMGLNVTYLKICAFTISAGIAGIGGGLYAHYMFFIEPHGFGFHTSLLILFYVLFGGYQTPWGAIAGAFILTLIPEVFRGLQDWRMVVYGALIVVMMAIRPQGLISKGTVRRIRSMFAAGPRTAQSGPGIPQQKGGGQDA